MPLLIQSNEQWKLVTIFMTLQISQCTFFLRAAHGTESYYIHVPQIYKFVCFY